MQRQNSFRVSLGAKRGVFGPPISACTDLVAGLDNLPGEVTFLLEEIREKDTRINRAYNSAPAVKSNV